MVRATASTPDSDVIVDDSRKDLIRYSSTVSAQQPWTWSQVASNLDYYNSSWAWAWNSSDSILFEFEGTRVAVYGFHLSSIIPDADSPTIASYTIDSDTVQRTTYSPPPNDVENHFHQLYFQSDLLPFGKHTLRIDIVDPGTEGFGLDWIEYNTTSPQEATSVASPLPSAPSTSVLSFPYVSSTQYPGPFVTPSVPNGASARSTFPAAIVAGVAAGAFVLIGIGFLYFFTRRREQRRRPDVEARDVREEASMTSAPSTPMTISTSNTNPRQSDFFARKSSATYTSCISGTTPISRNSTVASTSAGRPLPPVPGEGSQRDSAPLEGDTREEDDDGEMLPAYAP
ncbi:hypothetical protein L227DRAFT_566617 [Lentinus tigrinus ALCF2SS1-6]|uniref:Uncharacterized protein n=1 Tax=Lentinus tigrinus ALCF2SS1-6 TaxID=1328759 RepID=A0A5C2RX24_9APHY|nr:hypothetical protein L227DRAFT_566617 [Lentinus tigrinus ALCF2SS1-6]